MSTGMKDDDRIGWSGFQIFTQTSEVQTLALRIPVPELVFVVTSGAGPGLVKEKTGFAIVDVEVVTVELEAVVVAEVLLAECETVVEPEELSRR